MTRTGKLMRYLLRAVQFVFNSSTTSTKGALTSVPIHGESLEENKGNHKG